MEHLGSVLLWLSGAQTRCGVLTRSMLLNGPPTLSIRCAETRGMRPAKPPSKRSPARSRPPRQGCTSPPRQHPSKRPEELSLRALEEPRKPNRETTRQARLGCANQPDSRSGLLPQRRPPSDLQTPPDEATEALDKWVGCARRCRIPAFVKLQRSIIKHRAAILASIEHGLSNGRIESINTKIRLITRIAFGFKSPDALIALAMLSLGGHKPVLPGRI